MTNDGTGETAAVTIARPLTLGAVAAAAILLAGCGGSSGEPGSAVSSSPISSYGPNGGAGGVRVVVLPPASAETRIEIAACPRQPAHRFTLGPAALPRAGAVQPCRPGPGAGR